MGVMAELIRRADIPRGCYPVKAKTVFACKPDKHGGIEKFKARIVAQGFRQRKGKDYHYTYAPVTTLASVKTLLSVAAFKGLHIFGADVTAAYLQSNLKELLFLELDGKTYRLFKTLYGLKQAAFEWNSDLNKEMLRHQMQRSQSECSAGRRELG